MPATQRRYENAFWTTAPGRTPKDHMVLAVNWVMFSQSASDQIVLTGTPVVPVEG